MSHRGKHRPGEHTPAKAQESLEIADLENIKIARLWREAEHDFDAYQYLDRAIIDLMDDEALNMHRIETIASQLEPDSLGEFIAYIEDVVAGQSLKIGLRDGTSMDVSERIFVIPVQGAINEIQGDMDDRQREMEDALPAFGFCPKTSMPVILPVCFPLGALARITPQDLNRIRKILSDYVYALFDETTEPEKIRWTEDDEVEKCYRRILSLAQQMRDEIVARSIPMDFSTSAIEGKPGTLAPDGTTRMGQCFLIGVEVNEITKEESPKQDIWSQNPAAESDDFFSRIGTLFCKDEDQIRLFIQTSRKRWNATMNAPGLQAGYELLPPLPWIAARNLMLVAHVNQHIALALSCESQDSVAPERIRLSYTRTLGGLRISVMMRHRTLTVINIPEDLLVTGHEDLLSSLKEIYVTTEESEDQEPGPASTQDAIPTPRFH